MNSNKILVNWQFTTIYITGCIFEIVSKARFKKIITIQKGKFMNAQFVKYVYLNYCERSIFRLMGPIFFKKN